MWDRVCMIEKTLNARISGVYGSIAMRVLPSGSGLNELRFETDLNRTCAVCHKNKNARISSVHGSILMGVSLLGSELTPL